MPKKSSFVKINLDLLKPQSEPQRVALKLFKWLLSSGRFLVIIVEVLVLVAFLIRFKLDADLASTKEAIEQQVPYIESLAADEVLIRQTQFQLSSIRHIRSDSVDLAEVIKKIASKTPSSIILKTIQLQKDDKMNIKINGSAGENSAVASFMAGLKSETSFTDLNLADVSIEGNNINFTITFSLNGGKS